MRGKRVGSAQSARGIQPGGSSSPPVRACFLLGPPFGGVQGRPPAGAGPRRPSGAFPPRRCAATGSGSARKGQGAKVAARALHPGGSRRLYSAPPAPTSPFTPGPRASTSAPSLPAGRDGAPPPPTRLPTGPDCPQSAPNRAAPPGRGPAYVQKGARGRRRCRLPTRPVLKHGPRSLTRARVKGLKETPRRNEGEGRRAPAEVGSPPYGALGAHHRPVSPALSGRWSQSARDGTRKMVNYAWAGRSQRKLWWRPAAVLTCKSVVRPGYRGERLIEPSSSWFPPKFPSG